jgi:hypothetical protein
MMADGAAPAAGGGGAAPVTPVVPATPAPAWFGDAHKGTVEAKGWKTPDDAITSYTALEQIFGADKAGRTIVRPKDANDAAGIAAYNKAIGVPADVAGYKIPDTLKEDPLVSVFAASALKAGMPAAAFEAVLPEVLAQAETLSKQEETKTQQAEAAKIEALKGEWGQKFDRNTEIAKRAATVFPAAAGLSPEDTKAVQDAVMSNAAIRKLFSKIGEGLTEAQFVEGTDTGSFSPNKQAVQQKINKLREERIAGRVTESDYHSQMSVLGPQLESA